MIIDIATLTGACAYALGPFFTGMMSQHDDLVAKVQKAAETSGDYVWRLPMTNDYQKAVKSTVADIANIGSEKGLAGSSTAAHFIGRFINTGVKWAHLDIAGVAYDKKGTNPICPKGAVGFGVRLLNQFVKDNYESK